jgi:amino acid adenylation domain-containing protein
MLNKNNNKKLKRPSVQIGQGPSFSYNQNIFVGDLLEEHAKATPDRVAVRFFDQSLTYAQLNCQVNQLSNYLIKIGLEVGQKVAVYFTPCLEQIISILAIFKIGCSYIPLDIYYPIDRLLFMMKDCSVSCLLTQSALTANFSASNLSCITIDENWDVIKKQESIFYANNKPNDLAYIIYTSGSTGLPNGVKIHNLAINNHMFWMKDYFQFTPEDKIILKTALSFDPSIWELLLPFYVGCELVIAPQGANMDPNLLVDTIVEQSVTTVQLVPSFLKELCTSKQLIRCQSLQRVFCGGESLSTVVKKHYFEQLNCPLYNLYGPTEATIDITSHEVTNTARDLNTNVIGKPIYNTMLYVVDSKGELAEQGKEGELYIGSDSLSTGYYNRAPLTQERFINNPFEPQIYSRVYKTGDMVRWLADGNLEYLGRNNDQIKINGVRIEPSEIVLIILEDPSILDSVIVKKTDAQGYDYLACYIVPKEGMALNIDRAKSSLRSKLPHYMWPKIYIKLDKLPLTLNGKVDKSALPEPYFEMDFKKIAYDKNVTETEKKLLLIWQSILRTPINIDDNFFEMGGTSLLSLKLLSELQTAWKIKLSITEIFTQPTVKLQANLIQSRCKPPRKTEANQNVSIPNPIVTLQPEGTDSPLFLIHPIGGTLFWYVWLTKLLKKNRPIYGIQDPSIELEKPVFNSITEIAIFYVEHIKKIQPHGKYLIGGASFGTTVAMEIAYLLEQEGKEVLSVISLDGWGVYPDNLYSDSYFRKSMQRQHEDLKKSFGQLKLQHNTESLFDIQWHRLNLLKNYHVKNVGCLMALFKSEVILPIFQEINSPLNHWDNIFEREKLYYYLVPGNHETMFQKPHVEILASRIDTYLEMLGSSEY